MSMDGKYLVLANEARRRGHTIADNLHLCFQILTLASAIDRDCAARLAPYRLSESKFILLFLLTDRSDGLSPYELAECACVTRATITGLLDGMERDGLLTRRHDRKDRRKLLVCLTKAGRDTGRQLFAEHTNWIASLVADLNDQERDMLSRLLKRIWRRTNAGAETRDAGAEKVATVGACR